MSEMPNEIPTGIHPSARGRIPEFEGLRGVLAWTVVTAHVFFCCGWFGPVAGGTALLFQAAEAAVDVFMILSGFAIVRLLLVGREPFKTYIWRRACRIIPAYWAALAAGIALNGVLLANLSHLPPGSDRDGSIAVCQLGASRFWIDVPLHVLLLQGLAPFKLLPFAPFTFLGTAWSLSLEWQFYWVAPLAVWLALRSWVGALLIIAAVVVAPLFSRQIIGAFSDAFLPVKATFFAVGAITYLASCVWEKRRMAVLALATAPTIGAVLWWKMSGRWFEALLTAAAWLVVSMAVHFQTFGVLRKFLNSTPMQYLGRISYSTYLFHIPLLTLLQAGLWRWLGPLQFWQLLACTAVLGSAGTLLVSDLSWRLIEMPFQRKKASFNGGNRDHSS